VSLILNEPDLTHDTAQKLNEKMKKHKKLKIVALLPGCTKKFRQLYTVVFQLKLQVLRSD
jgi:hypothetical protein